MNSGTTVREVLARHHMWQRGPGHGSNAGREAVFPADAWRRERITVNAEFTGRVAIEEASAGSQ